MDLKNNFLFDKHQLNVCCKVCPYLLLILKTYIYIFQAKVFYKRILLQSFAGNYNNCEDKFISNQKTLLESGKSSDMSIVVGETKIPVHKLILATHSPVFEAMFSHNDTREAQEQVVNIPDFDVDVMKEFLLYIYTGIKPQNDRLTVDLLAVADKVCHYQYLYQFIMFKHFFQYQVLGLKTYCENKMLSFLSIDNVVHAFILADMYACPDLKSNCLNFIASNFDQVMQTKDWIQLCKTRNDLMVEVCEGIPVKNQQTSKGTSVARRLKM